MTPIRELHGFEERLLDELKDHVAARVPATETPARHGPAYRRWFVPGWRLVVAVSGAVVVVKGSGPDEWTPAPASAADILHDAALAARRQPELTARPDQFVFLELRVMIQRELGPDQPYETAVQQRWVPADDSPRWFARRRMESQPGGWEIQHFPKDVGRPAGYLADLPEDPEALLSYLRAHPVKLDLPPGADLKAVYDDPEMPYLTALSLLDGYVPPHSLGALYEVLASWPGATVVPGDVRDAAGRRGVALRMPGVIGGHNDIIFDRETFAYLGQRDLLVRGGQEFLFMASARLRTAIVDRPWQLP
jgi:hypothetical protein